MKVPVFRIYALEARQPFPYTYPFPIEEQGMIAGKPDCRQELTGERIGVEAV